MLSQNATLPAYPPPDENTPPPPEPAPQPDDDAGSEDQLSPNGSVEPEETEEEKAEKAKAKTYFDLYVDKENVQLKADLANAGFTRVKMWP